MSKGRQCGHAGKDGIGGRGGGQVLLLWRNSMEAKYSFRRCRVEGLAVA